jgi:hypothetical protein
VNAVRGHEPSDIDYRRIRIAAPDARVHGFRDRRVIERGHEIAAVVRPKGGA